MHLRVKPPIQSNDRTIEHLTVEDAFLDDKMCQIHNILMFFLP